MTNRSTAQPRRDDPARDAGHAPNAASHVPSPRSARRPEIIRRGREERRRRYERERRQWLLTRIAAVVVAVLLVGGVAYAGFAAVSDRQARQPPAGVQTFADLPRGHVDGVVAYAEVPPVGGDHSPVWQNCGFYEEPVGNERAVHSLEHGAVWITYRADLPTPQIDAVRALVDGQPFVLASPFPDLPTPVVASAWGNQLRLDSADSPDLARFVRSFARGPQTPEPGAPCTGGTSEAA